jgi:hypothetical protein
MSENKTDLSNIDEEEWSFIQAVIIASHENRNQGAKSNFITSVANKILRNNDELIAKIKRNSPEANNLLLIGFIKDEMIKSVPFIKTDDLKILAMPREKKNSLLIGFITEKKAAALKSMSEENKNSLLIDFINAEIQKYKSRNYVLNDNDILRIIKLKYDDDNILDIIKEIYLHLRQVCTSTEIKRSENKTISRSNLDDLKSQLYSELNKRILSMDNRNSAIVNNFDIYYQCKIDILSAFTKLGEQINKKNNSPARRKSNEEWVQEHDPIDRFDSEADEENYHPKPDIKNIWEPDVIKLMTIWCKEQNDKLKELTAKAYIKKLTGKDSIDTEYITITNISELSNIETYLKPAQYNIKMSHTSLPFGKGTLNKLYEGSLVSVTEALGSDVDTIQIKLKSTVFKKVTQHFGMSDGLPPLIYVDPRSSGIGRTLEYHQWVVEIKKNSTTS